VVHPFSPEIMDGELEQLRDRLRATRWPDRETDESQGVGLAELQELCAYWADGYDPRRLQARLDEVGQFKTLIDGLGIHFLHARSRRQDAFPLILTHGWPGSAIEFLGRHRAVDASGFPLCGAFAARLRLERQASRAGMGC
jgi:hypothetical protein